MIREVHEETGLRVRSHELAGVDSLHHRPGWRGQPDDFHAIRIIYRAVVQDETAPLVHEADGSTDLARWAAREELATMNLVDLAHTGWRCSAEGHGPVRPQPLCPDRVA